MGYITVKFIDKEYSIPADVISYADMVDFTNEIRDALMASFRKQIWPYIDVIESITVMHKRINYARIQRKSTVFN